MVVRVVRVHHAALRLQLAPLLEDRIGGRVGAGECVRIQLATSLQV
jgi:hypothetical protein